MATQPVQAKPAPCQCPACRGLECFEHPRFFAGQLLTEAELNGEQAYVLAKNRLHNRYLHGWGVVCGLEVVCHDCDGFVRVRSGYAIDPCGNDVIVCSDTDLDVLGAIRKCREANSRSTHNCNEKEEHWCIALEYRESEARGVMPLKEKASGHAKCGCGDKTSAANPAPSPTRPSACEPTRVLEQFRLTVIPEPASCSRQRLDRIARIVFPRPGSLIAAILPERFHRHPLLQMLVTAAPDTSLLSRAIAAVDTVDAFFSARFGQAELSLLTATARDCLGTPTDAGSRRLFWGSAAGIELCGRFRRAVCDLYSQNPLKVRCKPFDCPKCPEPPKPMTGGGGISGPIGGTDPLPVTVQREGMIVPLPLPPDASEVFCDLVNAVVNYLTDALCSLLIPPCPPEPCDERVILACVTVSDDKVVRICNHSCRRYAGSFPALEHWTSAVPFAAIVRQLVSEICCGDESSDAIRGVAARYGEWLGRDTIVIDPVRNPDTGNPNIDVNNPAT